MSVSFGLSPGFRRALHEWPLSGNEANFAKPASCVHRTSALVALKSSSGRTSLPDTPLIPAAAGPSHHRSAGVQRPRLRLPGVSVTHVPALCRPPR